VREEAGAPVPKGRSLRALPGMDNVEDKGMEEIRSHNFQSLIVQASKTARYDHQIIFTTSMMNPDLDLEQYVVGPRYRHENKTLSIPVGF
jgi:hypothetical protein